MIVRALDGNGDWTFGKGRNNYKQNNAAVAQSIQTRLLMFKNDCFFATDRGIDWFNLLGGKDLTSLNLAINAMILGTEGVTGILQTLLSLDSDRVMRVSYQAQTVYSVSLQGVFTYNFGAL